MREVIKRRATSCPFLAPLLAALLAGLCLQTGSSDGATATSSGLGSSTTATSVATHSLSRISPPPRNKFMIIYTLSDPSAGDISRLKEKLIKSFKKAQGDEDDTTKSLVVPSSQDLSATESDCEVQKAYCDVVWVDEKDWDERMTLELTVDSYPPNKHQHKDIPGGYQLTVCNHRSDWSDCRDRRLEIIVGMLAGMERTHQRGR